MDSPFYINTRQRERQTVSSPIRGALLAKAPGPVLDFGPERGSAKGIMADLGPLGTYFRLGYPRVGELHFCYLCNPRMALDLASSLSRKHLGS